MCRRFLLFLFGFLVVVTAIAGQDKRGISVYGNYQVKDGEQFVFVTTPQSGGATITLPPATTSTIAWIYICKYAGGSSMTVIGSNGDKISGAASEIILTNNKWRIYVTTGTNNWISMTGN